MEALRETAHSVLEAATPEDRIWLVTVDGEIAATGAASVSDAVDRVALIDGAGALPAAVERASTLADAGSLAAAAVLVLTDGQASAWARAAHTGNVPVTLVFAAEPPPLNRSVREAVPQPVRWAPRGGVTIAVQSDDSADVRVVLGERTLARTLAAPNATFTIRGTAGRDGWLAGRVELPPDELRADDVRHFAVFAGEAPAVRPDTLAGPFVRAALETLIDGNRLRRGGVIAITGAEAAMRRPVLAFAPTDPVRAGAGNRALAMAGIPWRFGDIVREETAVRGGLLDGIRVRTRFRLIPTDGGVVDTLATAGGEPWAVGGEGYVLVGSPMDPGATSLPVSAQFLPWIEATLARYLVVDGGPVLNATPLAPVTLPYGVDELITPQQRTLAIRARHIASPANAGVYWMRRHGGVVGALVVNAEPAESDLAALDPESAAHLIVGRTPAVVTTRDDVARVAFSGSSRRPLTGALLAALAGLLLVEMVIARESPRSQR